MAPLLSPTHPSVRIPTCPFLQHAFNHGPLHCCLSHLATPSPLSPGWWRLSLARLPSPLPRGLNPIPFAHSTGVNHHHENKRKHTSKGGKVFLWLYTHPLDPGSRCSPWSSFPAGLTSLLPFLPPSRQMPASGAQILSASSWKALH